MKVGLIDVDGHNFPTATVMGVTAAGHKIKSGDTGCKITCHANTEHKHIHKYELTVTQNIDDYSYVDMTGTDLRQVVKLLYNGNKDLLSNPVRSVDPNTGYRAFVNQSEYSSGNGRIAFSWALSEENKSGDGDDTLFTEGEEAARTWYTGELSGMRVVANIISDYLTLGTTEGYKL